MHRPQAPAAARCNFPVANRLRKRLGTLGRPAPAEGVAGGPKRGRHHSPPCYRPGRPETSSIPQNRRVRHVRHQLKDRFPRRHLLLGKQKKPSRDRKKPAQAESRPQGPAIRLALRRCKQAPGWPRRPCPFTRVYARSVPRPGLCPLCAQTTRCRDWHWPNLAAAFGGPFAVPTRGFPDPEANSSDPSCVPAEATQKTARPSGR